MALRLLILLTPLILLACDAQAPALSVSEIRVTAPVPGSGISAAYFSLRNPGDVPIRISQVSSPHFASVEIHETVLESGIARMRRVDELTLGAGERIAFSPGGLHLMLADLVGAPKSVTLEFYADGMLILAVTAPLGAES